MGYRLAIVLLAAGASLGAGILSATERGVRWGTQAPNVGTGVGVSSTNHAFDSQTAVVVAGGRTSLLPGATIVSVGVLNEINVIGDNNLIDATQTGTNTGEVTTTVTIAD